MDVVRTKIYLDDARCHAQGLLPYVPYDSIDPNIKYVTATENNGNWGQLVCDICSATSEIVTVSEGLTSGFTYMSKLREISGSRTTYKEIVDKYYKIQAILRKGVYVEPEIKKYYSRSGNTITDTEGCVECLTGQTEYEETVFVEKHIENYINGSEKVNKYSYEPRDINLYTVDKEHLFHTTLEQIPNTGRYVLVDGKEYIEYVNDWWTGTSAYQMFSGFSGTYGFCEAVEAYVLGKVIVPESYNGKIISGDSVSEYMNYSDIEKEKNWFETYSGQTGDATVKTWEDKGGNAMFEFLKSLDYLKYVPNRGESTTGLRLTFVPAYVSVPVLFEDQHEYNGVFESYVEGATEWTWEAYSASTSVSERTYWHSGEDEYAESKLAYVMDEEATELNGITGTWEKGGMYKCYYSSTSGNGLSVKDGNGYWRFSGITSEFTLTCGDGENVAPTTTAATSGIYRTIPLPDAVKGLGLTSGNGKTYFFLCKKLNGVSGNTKVTFRVPYTNHSFHNMVLISGTTYAGNYIKDMSISGGMMTIRYVIGGKATSEDSGETFTASSGTGIEHEETFPYVAGEKMIVSMNGYTGVTVYYDVLDTETTKETVYSDDYGMYRKANIAKVVGMEVGNVFDESILAPVFYRETVDSFFDDPTKILNVVIDRGSATAFESHFKLGECNSFEDMQNYGNNFFNLQEK